MAKVLDTYAADTIADALLEVLEDLGFPAQEAIPGLCTSINRLAAGLIDHDKALDEAVDLLS
jgi:hypothetical protein